MDHCCDRYDRWSTYDIYITYLRTMPVAFFTLKKVVNNLQVAKEQMYGPYICSFLFPIY